MKLILMDTILKVVVNLSKIKDITGEKYNKLTAIKYIGKTKNGSAIWLWKCDCGNEKEIIANSVKTGNTKSCGHILSFKEEEIEKILKKNNIKFKRQFSFSDLRDKQPLKFDFAIFKNNNLLFLIEYNGEQHYDKTSYYYSNILEKHDKMKIDYCGQNKIKLLILDKNSNLEKDILDNMKG